MPRPHVRPNLNWFARQVATRLPGTWTTGARLPVGLSGMNDYIEVWDSQNLDWATAEFSPWKAAVLSGPRGERLLALAHPRHPTNFIVGALAPPGLGHDPVGDEDAPLAITVTTHPARAASDIARRFLPRYAEAVARIRLPALADALGGAAQAEADWDAVSDSLCDSDGQPLDEAAYGEGQRQRDAAAWLNLQTFLFHGPAVLADGHAALPALVLDPAVAEQWRWRLGALQAALDGGLRIHAEWEATHPRPVNRWDAGEQQRYAAAVAERDAEGWTYASEFIAHGPVLLDIARAAAASPVDNSALVTARAEAARARSTTDTARVRPTSPGEPPPSHLALGAPHGPCTR